VPTWAVVALPVAALAAIGLIIAIVLKHADRPRRENVSGARQARARPEDAPKDQATLIQEAAKGQAVEEGVAAAANGGTAAGEEVAGPARQMRPAYEGADVGDENIALTGVRMARHETGWVYVGGVVKNRHPSRALAEIKIAVDMVDADGKLVRSEGTRCAYVPKGRELRFAVEFPGLKAPGVRVGRTRIGGRTWAAQDLRCLPVDKLDYDDSKHGEIHLHGRFVNDTGRPLAAAKLYCDFFYDTGLKARASPAFVPLQPKGDAGSGSGELEFAATFEIAMPELVKGIFARVVAE
jgi:hypothetical protein